MNPEQMFVLVQYGLALVLSALAYIAFSKPRPAQRVVAGSCALIVLFAIPALRLGGSVA